MNGNNKKSARPGSFTRFSRGTRAALIATPSLVFVGWLSPHIYGVQLTLPRALCTIVAIGITEAVIEEDNYSFLERELVTSALWMALSIGFAAVIDLFWRGSV